MNNESTQQVSQIKNLIDCIDKTLDYATGKKRTLTTGDYRLQPNFVVDEKKVSTLKSLRAKVGRVMDCFTDYKDIVKKDSIYSHIRFEFKRNFKNDEILGAIVPELEKAYLNDRKQRHRAYDEKIKKNVDELKEFVKKNPRHIMEIGFLNDKYIDNMVSQQKGIIEEYVSGNIDYKDYTYSQVIGGTDYKKALQELEEFNSYKVPSKKQNVIGRMFNSTSSQVDEIRRILKENIELEATSSSLDKFIAMTSRVEKKTCFMYGVFSAKQKELREKISANKKKLEKIDVYNEFKSHLTEQQEKKKSTQRIEEYKRIYKKKLELLEDSYANGQKIQEINRELEEYARKSKMTAEEIEKARHDATQEYNEEKFRKESDARVEAAIEERKRNEYLQQNTSTTRPDTLETNTFNGITRPIQESSVPAYNAKKVENTRFQSASNQSVQKQNQPTPNYTTYDRLSRTTNLDKKFSEYGNLLGSVNFKYGLAETFKEYIRKCDEKHFQPTMDSFAKYLMIVEGTDKLPDGLRQDIYDSKMKVLQSAGFDEVFTNLKTNSIQAVKNNEVVDKVNNEENFNQQVEQMQLKISNACIALEQQLNLAGSFDYYQMVMNYVKEHYKNLNIDDLAVYMSKMIGLYGLNINPDYLLSALKSSGLNLALIDLNASVGPLTHSDVEIGKFINALTGSTDPDYATGIKR